MKKGLKIAGTIAGIAALASLLPYSCKKDEETDELTVKALLWKYSNQPDHEIESNRKVSIDIGFHNPFASENDDLLMDDGEEEEPILDCSPIPTDETVSEEETPCEVQAEVSEGDCIPF